MSRRSVIVKRKIAPAAGDTVYVIDSLKVIECVFIGKLPSKKIELKKIPSYEKMIVEDQDIYTQKDLAITDLVSEQLKARKISGHPDSYDYCEMCFNITIKGKSCECSRWA